MPDLCAHILLGLVIAYVFSKERKSIALFGAILPDIKIFVYALATPLLGLTNTTALILPIHSPFGSLLLACFFASLMPAKDYKKTLFVLSLGVLSHHMLDAFMYPVNGIEHYLLLYPLTWEPYGLGLGDAVYAASFLGFAVVSSSIAIKAAGFIRSIMIDTTK